MALTHSKLATTPDAARRVIQLRYGLEDGYNRTLAELGVSRERVRQIEAEALTKLRACNDTKRLKDYLD